MNLIWQILSRLGAHPFAVYRRALYEEELQATSPPAGVEVVLGDADRLAPFAQNAEYQLSRKFIDQAFAEGHQVVLTYLDTRLAAYGWVNYSATPHSNGWWVEFAPGHRYVRNSAMAVNAWVMLVTYTLAHCAGHSEQPVLDR